MNTETEQTLLRVHLSNFAKWHTGPLVEALVGRARREHLAGATVLSGVYGYVDRGRILGAHPAALAAERPVVVEFVDREETLLRFLATVRPMLESQPVLMTLERARVVPPRAARAGEAT